MSDCMTKIGETIKLTCKVTGSPKPVVSWLKGQNILPCSAQRVSQYVVSHIFFTHSLTMSTSKMAFLWMMTLVTSSQQTAQEAAVSSWTASLHRTLDSTPATPAASWAALGLWPRFPCKVSTQVLRRRGDKTSNSATILFFFFPYCPAPPRFVCRLESACLIEGEDIQFTCSTQTTPLPRVRYSNSANIISEVVVSVCI